LKLLGCKTRRFSEMLWLKESSFVYNLAKEFQKTANVSKKKYTVIFSKSEEGKAFVHANCDAIQKPSTNVAYKSKLCYQKE
jgi:hypothetical protein